MQLRFDRLFILSAAITLAMTMLSFAAAPSTRPKTQQSCLPETDPASPRKSQLTSDNPGDQILRIDVDNDGDPDILERWFNKKRIRWIDENDNMIGSDAMGDQTLDALQIDRDGDGYYDGPGDLNIKWVDDDGDGRADVQIFAANPRLDQRGVSSGTSHFMVFIDTDKDGVNGYIDWNTFEFSQANWRVPPTTSPTMLIPPPNFSPDYMGDTIFLKQHLPAWVIADIRLNWENPFAFYDPDNDGCSEMSIRLLDDAERPTSDPSASPKYSYTGFVFEAYTGWDLDNDATKGNEFDFDMSWRFSSDIKGTRGGRIDYRKYSDPHPKMKAPQWVIDGKYFRFDNWRKIEDFCYVTIDKCFEETWKTDWGDCWIVFDEDDDDHRWERVELYYPPGDVYSTQRWIDRKRGTGGLPGHPQSDTLGDRGEWDADNSGKGKVYIGAWDGKIHLFGAEKGAWSVDEKSKYWGSSPVLGNSSPQRAQKVEELVQYFDTDNNGYFDKITYDYDGDKTDDLVINLLDYKSEGKPHPDNQPLHNPAELKWEGMHKLYTQICAGSFQDGLTLYRALWKKGLATPELDNLSFASSTGDRYNQGYWMKEKIFRLLDKRLSDNKDKQAALRKAHFTGDINTILRLINDL